ncbi:MAG: hypothetical protein WCI11_02950 [Candidatus Methylumidiphilus sp.]
MTLEQIIRVLGLVLQIGGILTVFRDINGKRKHFNLPSLLSSMGAKLKTCINTGLIRLHLRRGKGVSGVCSVATAPPYGKARSYGMHMPDTNATIEPQLEAIEKNIISIHDRISMTQNEMDDESRKTASALKCQEQSMQAEDSAIRDELKTIVTGGVHISIIGAVLLLVGVILSTIPSEIIQLLRILKIL